LTSVQPCVSASWLHRNGKVSASIELPMVSTAGTRRDFYREFASHCYKGSCGPVVNELDVDLSANHSIWAGEGASLAVEYDLGSRGFVRSRDRLAETMWRNLIHAYGMKRP
jgi:hypothetical protein